jgi:hypothetical protein
MIECTTTKNIDNGNHVYNQQLKNIPECSLRRVEYVLISYVIQGVITILWIVDIK